MMAERLKRWDEMLGRRAEDENSKQMVHGDYGQLILRHCYSIVKFIYCFLYIFFEADFKSDCFFFKFIVGHFRDFNSLGSLQVLLIFLFVSAPAVDQATDAGVILLTRFP